MERLQWYMRNGVNMDEMADSVQGILKSGRYRGLKTQKRGARECPPALAQLSNYESLRHTSLSLSNTPDFANISRTAHTALGFWQLFSNSANFSWLFMVVLFLLR